MSADLEIIKKIEIEANEVFEELTKTWVEAPAQWIKEAFVLGYVTALVKHVRVDDTE